MSPIFDVSRSFIIVHLPADGIVSCRQRLLASQNPVHRAMTLVTWQVQKVLCGGISRDYQEALESAGIVVIPHIRGTVQDVVRAYVNHQLAECKFSIPGCHAPCKWCRARRRHP